MKKIRTPLALFLALVIAFSCTVVVTAADESEYTIKMMNYNVAGMPKFDGTDGDANHKAIAGYIVENSFDIVAVQEDFHYHDSLTDNLDGFNYFTNHSGSVPGGDGLNIFTKTMPIYNETRVQWKDSFGSISEGDTLTPKGILYSVIEIADGVYIDFYNIHADAFDSEGSRIARKSNYLQLVEMISENYAENGRAVIVTGDFNHFLHATPEENSDMFSIFHEQIGLKDAWVEIKNHSDYFDFSSWIETGTSYWGAWDSVEKFMYMDGIGVSVEALDFDYTWIKNDAGEDVSDHAAAECTFKFTVTDEAIEKDPILEVVEQLPFRNLINTIMWIIKDFKYIIENFDELLEFLA